MDFQPCARLTELFVRYLLQLYLTLFGHKGAFKYYISDKGGEGGLTSIAYVAYTFRGGGEWCGLIENKANSAFELSLT